jgi:putative transposase
MPIRRELIDELLKDTENPQDILGEDGLLKELSKAVIERALVAERDTHLGYDKHERKGQTSSNARNGYSQKSLKGELGQMEIAVPRDRQAEFEPQLVKKGQTRLAGLDEQIIAFSARGMTTRDIQGQLQEIYGVEVSATLISNVTEAVMDEVRQWQARPLEALSPIVYVDCLLVKVRENQRIGNFALSLALGVDLDGEKDLLGMWLAQNEGARVLARGVHRIAEPRRQGYLHGRSRWPHRLA